MYLISQFLSLFTNRRDDRYGRDVGARAIFAREAVRASRERLGREYPILFRLNAIEDMEGGQTLADALSPGRILAEKCSPGHRSHDRGKRLPLWRIQRQTKKHRPVAPRQTKKAF